MDTGTDATRKGKSSIGAVSGQYFGCVDSAISLLLKSVILFAPTKENRPLVCLLPLASVFLTQIIHL